MIDGLIKKVIYKIYEKKLEKEVRKGVIPKHVAIIMDGNRRFARLFSMKPWEGHRKGAEKLEEVLDWCYDLGIKYVTTYAFSTENFKRSREEVERLFDLFVEYFNKIAKDEKIHKRRVRVKVIGRKELFPERVINAIKKAENATKKYRNFYLNIALGYGGRDEILNAVKRIAERVKKGELKIEDIDEKIFSKFLYTNGAPDPDLIIRTSGEERISGFLLWQCAYSELYFCDTFWPAFRKIDFLRAIRTFQQRQRRFGR